MSVRKGNKIIAGSYAVVKPEVYTKVETDDLLNQKQDKLIAGNNIFIDENNVISSSGGSGSFINVVQETGDSTEDVMSQASVTYELEQKANTIDLADVSLSGDYEDLSNTPDLSVYTKTEDLAEIAFTADYEDLGNTPDLTLYAKNEELSKVATTNNYNDLDNKPNLELYDTTISVNNKLSLKQDLLTAGEGISIEGNTISSTVNSAEWGNIIGDITNQADLQERLNGKLGIDFDNITEEGVKNLANIIGTGDYMFDTRLVDHELTYEESKGWALQGTYVYKEAVAGSRYGYPDFYNKCVEEFENSVFDKPNVNTIGSLVNNSGVLSGFSSDSYAKLPVSFNPESNSWEIVFKARTGSIFDAINIMFYSKSFAFQTHQDGKLRLFLGSDGSSYDIANGVVGNSVLTINTLYNFKVEFTGTQYKAYYSTTDTFGEPDITVNSTVNIYPSTICIGLNDSSFSYPWTGSIDLSDAYININGERWWSGNLIYKNPNGHLFYDIANKTQVDELYNTNGIAWYYGIDKENERIFLPRTKWFIQPTGEITEVNTVNEAGLPNITGGINAMGGSSTPVITGCSGAFQNGPSVSTTGLTGSGSVTRYNGATFDASRSSSIYGNSTTVQPPSINQLLYICVGNTVADTSWVDVVTQVENGVKDINDAVNNGVSRLNTIDALKTTQITNCLLEVPQRVKLELNNGVLTLKAGSQIIVPNGFEEDGVTPRFDYVDIESDKTYTATSNGTCALFYTPTLSSLNGGFTSVLGSGTSVPTTGDSIYYKTDINTLAYYKNGALQHSRSFPLALFTVSNNTITSINQTFNGLGYIGSTVWVDKGVKGLIPNGRNEDGSLRNIEIITEKLTTVTYSRGTPNVYFGISHDGSVAINGAYKYKEQENRNWHTNNNTVWNVGVAGVYDIADNGSIVNFKPKRPFRAVDYNELKSYITETYVNGSSWYRVWSDGWKEQGGKTSHITVAQNQNGGLQINFLKPFKDTNYTPTMSVVNGGDGYASLQPNVINTTQTGMYLSAWGQDGSGIIAFSWYVCGY